MSLDRHADRIFTFAIIPYDMPMQTQFTVRHALTLQGRPATGHAEPGAAAARAATAAAATRVSGDTYRTRCPFQLLSNDFMLMVN